MSHILKQRAQYFHRYLRSLEWLELRRYGIMDAVIYSSMLGWNGERITVPLFDRNREVRAFEYWKLDDDGFVPDEDLNRRNRPELYGWDVLSRPSDKVILCEDVMERLVLMSHAFSVMSLTGSKFAFKEEWAERFKDVKAVYLLFRNRSESVEAAERIAGLLPNAHVVDWPAEMEYGAGVHEYLVTLKHRRTDLLRLLEQASTPPQDGQQA